MKRSRKGLWRRLVLVGLTLPLVEVSCVEIAERVVINGFFDAATPLASDCLDERLSETDETQPESSTSG